MGALSPSRVLTTRQHATGSGITARLYAKQSAKPLTCRQLPAIGRFAHTPVVSHSHGQTVEQRSSAVLQTVKSDATTDDTCSYAARPKACAHVRLSQSTQAEFQIC